MLGPSLLGSYQYYMSIVGFCSVFTLFGGENTIVSKVSKYVYNNNYVLVKSVLKFFGRAIFLIGFIFVPIILSIFNIINIESLKYFLPIIFLNILCSFEKFYSSILIAFKNQFISVLMVNVVGPILFLFLLFFNKPINSYESALFCRGLSYLIIISFLVLFCKKFNRGKNDTKIINYKKSWVTASLITFGISLINLSILVIDNYFLITFLNTSSVSFYNISYKISSFISFGLIIFSLTIAPLIQEVIDKSSNLAVFQKKITKFIKMNFIISTLTFSLTMFSGNEILGFFGEEFKDALPILKILSLAHFLRSLFGPINTVLIMTNLKKHLFYVLLITLLVHLTLNYPLIIIFGAAGVGMSELISLTLVGLYCGYFASKKLNIDLSILSLFKNSSVK